MSKKIGGIIILLLCGCNLFAQKQQVKNQPYGDYKLYHFGITVGMNFQDMLLTNVGLPGEDGQTWYATIPDYSPGFTVGLIADLYLNPFMNLRFTPTLSFGDKSFEFVEPDSDERFKTVVRSNYLTAPLDVKFRSMRLNNYRPYVLAGLYAALDLGRKKDEVLLMKPMDYGLTIGLGCDFYLPIIKVVPEIRFCFGLKDILEKDRSDLTDLSLLKYPGAISKGRSRMIVITFNFE
ncbi:MAG: PorT family protein [Candidatus Symbiothrix sp.]|nr:PorT family protein [Candidatus Symbiothrix sp.]